MSTKPKRIKALVRYIDADDFVWVSHELARTNNVASEPCYVLRQSDVRALAEQIDCDYWKHANTTVFPDDLSVVSMLYALKRAGITPGKETK